MSDRRLIGSRSGGELRRTERNVEEAINSLATDATALAARVTVNEGDIAALQARLGELDRFRSYGRALRFDGANDDANAGAATNGDPGTGLLLAEAVFRLNASTGSGQQIFGKRDGLSGQTTDGWNISYIDSLGLLSFQVCDGSTARAANFSISPGPGLLHAKGLYLPDDDEMYLFLNGVEVASNTATLGSVTSVGYLSAGACHTGGGVTSRMDGDLMYASVRFGTHTRASVLAEGAALPASYDAGDIYFPANEGTGVTLADGGSTSTDLTITGATWVDDGENWYRYMREGY